MTTAADRASVEVESTMYAALAILRVVVLLNALVLTSLPIAGYDHPVAAVVVLGLLVLWTAVALWCYARPRLRTTPLLVADLAVAVTAIGVSPWVKGEPLTSTLPGFWVAGVMLAWAIHWRLPGGVAAAVAIAVADYLVRTEFTRTNYANIFLICLGGVVVGYLTGQVQSLARDRARAERAAASAAERARLARVVHDGVLQVLALVQRRGSEIGGEAADLGRLAGEQEAALRTLVQRPDPVLAGLGRADLAEQVGRLEARATPQVRVTTPGHPVEMPAGRVEEVVAVVRACLHNVADHVGEDATAWVLVEDLGGRVVVTVRDDGPGIEEGRLLAAAESGRLGVVESIRGRVSGLAGTATLTTAPGQGTEWEIDVPKEAT